jgi:excinuclease Cho
MARARRACRFRIILRLLLAGHAGLRQSAPVSRPRIPYSYPEHLRESSAALPAAPGVYLFHGEDERLPLYIGKSVNLRSRVLAHLRNRREARMLHQARRIAHLRTAGEIGALLLEARLIKERYPLLNKRLRRNLRLCAWRLGAAVPEIVYAQHVDFAHEPDLFGLFASRHAAIQLLETIADEEHLCLGALGLERLQTGRPCFRQALGRCAGLCAGLESPLEHQTRLRNRLEAHAVRCWPWHGAVGLVEQDAALTEIHVVRNWCHLGSVSTEAEARELSRVTAGFDADCYRILYKPLLQRSVQIVEL